MQSTPTPTRKRLLLATTLVVLAAVSPTLPSHAVEGYMGISAGTWSPNKTSSDFLGPKQETSYDTGWALSGLYGVKFENNIRMEFEAGYKQADAKKISDEAWVFDAMINAWYTLPLTGGIAPYVGGGFGIAKTHTASATIDNTVTGVAYQLGGGLDIPINDKTSIDLGYRYFGTTSTSTDTPAINDTNLTSSVFSLGIRSKF